VSSSLGQRAARGALVTIGAQAARILLQLASVIVLARLLSPHDYGLVAMVVAIIGVGEILRDFGLSSAAVQAETLSTAQRTTLFWLNTAIGALLGLVVLAIAPLIAAVYGQPELVPIARALAVTFLLNGLATQYRASLVRDLRFVALARTDVAAAAIALAVAIAAALAQFGYWAIVAQQLTGALALVILLATAARWLPGVPRRATSIRGLVGFGGNVVLSQLIGYVSNNVDSFVIGVRFGAGPLGIYSRAFQLLMTPLNQIRSPLTSVALPVLSRLSMDATRFGRFVTLGQLALGYTLVAGLGIVVGAAEPLTALLLGNQWTAAAPILRLLACAGIFQTLAFVGYWVYLARGLTRELVRYSLVSAVIRISCILVGSLGGVVGVAWGYAVAPALAWPISLWWLSRRTDLPTRALYAGAGRILGTVAVGAAATWGATLATAPLGALVQVATGVVALVAAYGLAFVVPAIRRDLRNVLALGRLIRTDR
jgi:PST family polysaccharide transporter